MFFDWKIEELDDCKPPGRVSRARHAAASMSRHRILASRDSDIGHGPTVREIDLGHTGARPLDE